MPGQPSAIYIIRHGEKPDDPDAAAGKHAATASGPFGVDIDGNQNPDSLIPQGWQRAGGLAGLFDPTSNDFQSGVLLRPQVIGVPSYGKPEHHRTYETVLPLSLKLGLTPNPKFAVGKESDLAAWILQQAGQIVLICWEHDHIIDITTALAPVIADGDVPGPWPGDRFDIVVALIPTAGDKYMCIQVQQMLLAGDSLEIIPPAN